MTFGEPMLLTDYFITHSSFHSLVASVTRATRVFRISMYRYPCCTRFKGRPVNKGTPMLTESCNTFFSPPAAAFPCFSVSLSLPPSFSPSFYISISFSSSTKCHYVGIDYALCTHVIKQREQDRGRAKDREARYRAGPGLCDGQT